MNASFDHKAIFKYCHDIFVRVLEKLLVENIKLTDTLLVKLVPKIKIMVSGISCSIIIHMHSWQYTIKVHVDLLGSQIFGKLVGNCCWPFFI